jgi:hypothetical protein
MKPDYQKIFEALGVTPIVERIIRNRHLVPSKAEIYPNFETLIYQDVILLQTPRQVIERDPAMCRILSMIAARFSYGTGYSISMKTWQKLCCVLTLRLIFSFTISRLQSRAFWSSCRAR